MLSDHPVRLSIPVSDIARAAEFYEQKLRLPLQRSAPSGAIENGGRVYEVQGEAAVFVYETPLAGRSEGTVAIWFVDDLDGVVTEIAANGVEFIRYDGLEFDANGITPRAGGGRIAWFQDPDGNTFAVESDN